VNPEKLQLKHRELVEHLLASHPPVTCELSFASLFAWRKTRNMSVLEVDDSAVLLVKREQGYMLFGPPLGTISIGTAMDAAQAALDAPVIACERIPEPIARLVDPARVPLFEDRNNSDYVYRREDLSELGGRRYHKKRNLIAQVQAEHACSYEHFSSQLIPEIKDMQERWCAQHDCGKTPGLCHEYRAIMELLDSAHQLDILGGAIRIGGAIQAYALGSTLNANTAAEHFEKAMPKFKGLYQLMNQWFCQNLPTEIVFVNREQDVGVEGLRQAKESYFPDHMVKKFVALHGISREAYEELKTKEARCTETSSNS